MNTFTEAVQTIDPKQAVGKLSSLWVNFAKFYEKNKQIEDSRVIFEKATHVAYLKVTFSLLLNIKVSKKTNTKWWFQIPPKRFLLNTAITLTDNDPS